MITCVTPNWLTAGKLSVNFLQALILFSLTAAPLCAGGNENEDVPVSTGKLEVLKHGEPSTTVDLGVGLYSTPIPWDWNGDGKMDLFVISGGTDYQGFYYFENTGRLDPETGEEVFAPSGFLSGRGAGGNASYPEGQLRVLCLAGEYPDILKSGLSQKVPLPVNKRFYQPSGRLRGHSWNYADYDGDGKTDLFIGVGDWTDYGWDDAFDENGRWVAGPLHGFVYWMKNTGDNANPQYAPAQKIQADGRDIDVYGGPTAQLADFRGTGKHDIICGEFLDGFTFFENIGTRTSPKYAPGRRLSYQGKPITMPCQMIQPVAFDWNRDGKMDLVVGQEDGRVAWMENTGNIVEVKDRYGKRVGEIPEFKPPRFFRQAADRVKFGCLTTPLCFDWDGDGREDILSGNAAGELAFIKNLGGNPPKWAEPEVLQAGGKPFRVLAGYNGSIQGPAEAKWGYTNLGAGDWDGDGLPDLLVNSILGKVVWLRNVGTRQKPELAAPKPVEVAWGTAPPKPAWNWWDPEPGELVTQWRTTPCMIDLDKDGINDLVSLDHEGYLAFFRQVEKDGRRILLPGQRSIHLKSRDGSIAPWHLTTGLAGSSGRRTFCLTDWDGDGKEDLLLNSTTANFYKNVSTKEGEWVFEDRGALEPGVKNLSGHGSPPATADWDGDGIPDLVLGSESGFFYRLKNPRSDGQ